MVNDVRSCPISLSSVCSIVSGIFHRHCIYVYRAFPKCAYLPIVSWWCPSHLFFFGVLGKKIKKYSRRIQTQISAMFSVVEEVLNSIKIVKAFRREDDEFKDFQKINHKHLKQWQRSQIYAAMNVPLSELNTTITGVVVVIIGGGMILNPAAGFSLGDFTAFLFAVFSMLHPLKSITQLYPVKKRGHPGPYCLVLNQVSSIQDAPDAVPKPDFEQDIVFDRLHSTISRVNTCCRTSHSPFTRDKDRLCGRQWRAKPPLQT